MVRKVGDGWLFAQEFRVYGFNSDGDASEHEMFRAAPEAIAEAARIVAEGDAVAAVVERADLYSLTRAEARRNAACAHNGDPLGDYWAEYATEARYGDAATLEAGGW